MLECPGYGQAPGHHRTDAKCGEGIDYDPITARVGLVLSGDPGIWRTALKSVPDFFTASERGKRLAYFPQPANARRKRLV